MVNVQGATVMRAWLPVATLIVAGMSGCASVEEPQDVPDPVEAILPATYADGAVDVEIPVPVVLIGFNGSVAAALQEELAPRAVEHSLYGYARSLLAPEGDHPPLGLHHVQPQARYEVHSLPLDGLDDLPKEDGLYLAREAEDAVVALLEGHGLAPHPGGPTLVFLNLDDTGHSYRMQYETGYVDGVRVFGERHPVLIMDTSAAVDPWVGDGQPYNRPMQDPDIETLVAATHTATEFRLLQGPIYPPTTKTCHAVTLVTAVRGTALSTHLPGYADPRELVDVENLTASWESLLGEGRVFIDSVFLDLPLDDPGLEVVLRNGPSDALRFWIDENWDDYHVAHEGCEAYVSLFIMGDASDSGVSGIAMYDVRDDRRLSWSAMNDMTRFNEEQDGAFAPIFYNDDDSRERLDWLNFLYTHETGHLFGQRHPHDISTPDGGGVDTTYSSIWSAMSYQQDGKIPLFGAIDANNHARNRAGFLLDEVLDQQPDANVTTALQHMGELAWWDAAYELERTLHS